MSLEKIKRYGKQTLTLAMALVILVSLMTPGLAAYTNAADTITYTNIDATTTDTYTMGVTTGTNVNDATTDAKATTNADAKDVEYFFYVTKRNDHYIPFAIGAIGNSDHPNTDTNTTMLINIVEVEVENAGKAFHFKPIGTFLMHARDSVFETLDVILTRLNNMNANKTAVTSMTMRRTADTKDNIATYSATEAGKMTLAILTEAQYFDPTSLESFTVLQATAGEYVRWAAQHGVSSSVTSSVVNGASQGILFLNEVPTEAVGMFRSFAQLLQSYMQQATTPEVAEVAEAATTAAGAAATAGAAAKGTAAGTAALEGTTATAGATACFAFVIMLDKVAETLMLPKTANGQDAGTTVTNN